MLDIDARGNPDIVCDARDLADPSIPGEFDAVYCSHNLEHYYVHDGRRVLHGFVHVLRDDGFAEIRVPDLESVMRHVVEKGMDIEDVLYRSSMGPITARDVIYGYAVEIERWGTDYYAHKTGFTGKSLMQMLRLAGFKQLFLMRLPAAFELRAFAFKTLARSDQCAVLGLSAGNR